MLNLAFAFFLLFPQQTQAPPHPGTAVIAAKTQQLDETTHVASASGDVEVTYEDISVKADTVEYNEETGELTAPGHFHLERAAAQGKEKIDGDNLKLNLKTNAGTMSKASGYIGLGYYFKAAEVQRFEDEHYELTDGSVTTCDEEKPGWTFESHRLSVIPGRSVSATGSIFRLEGFPIFKFPYVVIPTIEREQSSGFMIPSTSTSTTKGRSVRDEFYWAINRSADARITGEYFSKRGPALQLDFRAVANKNSRLEVSGFFVKDKLGQGGQRIRIFNYSDLGNGYRGVVDMNLVSSFLFRQVFEEGFNTISSPIQHSLAFLTRNEPGYSYNVEYNQSGIFFTDQPTVTTRKLPAFEGGIPERQLGNLPMYFHFDAGVAGISRHDAAIQTPAFVGRVDFHPELEIPLLRFDGLEWSHTIGVRETGYTAQRTSGAVLNRFLVDYNSRIVGPSLERDFGSWRHVVEPSIEYKYVDGSARFRDTVAVDDVDLLTDTNEVEYAVTNRFFTNREIFSWRIAQQYYFDPTFGGAIRSGVRNTFAPLLDLTGFAFADGERHFSPIVSNLRLSTSVSTSTDVQVDYDSERHRFEGAGINGGVNHGTMSGNVAYFFRRGTSIQFPSNQLRGNFALGNSQRPGVSFALSGNYDVERSLFQSSVAQVSYNRDCYGVSLEWMQFNIGARKESRIRFAFSLKNIGSLGNIRPQDRIF